MEPTERYPTHDAGCIGGVKSSSYPHGSRRQMILWISVSVLILLGMTWCVVNWKSLHLVYCRQLLRSENDTARIRGIELMARHHLKKGMPIEEVRRLMLPVQFSQPKPTMAGDYYCTFDIAALNSKDGFYEFLFDKDCSFITFAYRPYQLNLFGGAP